MTLKLEDVKGLGKKTVGILNDAGINSVVKLANSDLEDISAIKGIGKTSAKKYIDNAKKILDDQAGEEKTTTTTEEVSTVEESSEELEEEKKIQEELQKLKEKKEKLKDKKVDAGDFILVKITGKTQKGTVFRVSSEEDARKAGIYDEKKAKQGYYSPEFVIVGKPGFLNEGLTETVQNMNYFEKKSVRIPPGRAFGKRDPKKIERIGIAKFRKLNDGKAPEIGKEFVKKGQGSRGVVTNIVQGKVIVDYNHPLAGQHVDYNIEIIDKIEEFDEKIEHFMLSKGIPKDNIADFKINYIKDEKTVEITIPKMFLFQNLTYLKFGIAMDLQSHMADEVGDIKFIEIYEKIPVPAAPSESVMQKVEEYNKEQNHDHDHNHNHDHNHKHD